MSRIGRMPISIPANVTVAVKDGLVTVTGPKGTLTQEVNKAISVKNEANVVTLTRAEETNEVKAMHGLYRALVANMVKGVTEGFSKKLIFNGVGYKVQKTGNKLVLNLGFSHNIIVEEKDGIKLEVNGNEITVSGRSKEAVGQMAAEIRALKPVEPYHAYGVRYSDEVVVRKVGKTAAKK